MRKLPRRALRALVAMVALAALLGRPDAARADITDFFSDTPVVLPLDAQAGGSNGPLAMATGMFRLAPHLAPLEHIIAVRPAAATPGQLQWVARTGAGSPLSGGGIPVTTVRGLAVGDFDGDGLDDLAILPDGTASVAVGLHRQTGSGLAFDWTLEALPLPFAPGAISTGDLDADGRDDLVVSFDGRASIALLRGQPRGSGNVVVATSITAPIVPSSFAVAAWDANALADLLLFSEADGLLRVLLSDGAGGATPADEVAVPAPRAGAAADLDGDGDADLVAASAGAEPALRTYLRDGTGALHADRVHALPEAPGRLVVGRLTSGPRPGAAVILAGAREVRVFLNSGRGSLVPVGGALAGVTAEQLVARDLRSASAIGVPDLVVGAAGSSDLRLAEGLEQPFRLLATAILTAGFTLRDGLPAFGDVNGDGLEDIVFRSAPGQTPPQGAQCFLQQPGRRFAAAPNLVTTHDFTRGVLLADVRGSALPDLVGVSYDPLVQAGTSLVVVAENIGGEMQLREVLQTGSVEEPRTLQYLAAGDWDGDGRTDVAVTDDAQGEVLVLTADADGVFRSFAEVAVGATGSLDLVAGDLTGDGRPELVWCDYVTTEVVVLLNDGAGGFARGVAWADPATPGSNIVGAAIRDVTHDGVADLVVFNRGVGRVVGVLPGRGDGTFDPVIYSGTTSSTAGRALADLDGDGVPEVVIGGTTHTASRAVSLTALRLTAPGVFGTLVPFRTVPEGTDVVPVSGVLLPHDFDRDGRIDVAGFVGSALPADPGVLWNLGAPWGGGVVPSSAAWVE